MRQIIPRTIAGAGTVINITDDNGAAWDVEEIMSGTFDARSSLYTPMAKIYGSSLDDVKAKISSYANTHSVYFNFLSNSYIDKNNALWFRKNQWNTYATGKLPPPGTQQWMAETGYYKPYTMVTGNNEFELKSAIDGFASSYKGEIPKEGSSTAPASPPLITELPPVVIKAEPIIPGPSPVPAPVVAQAAIGGGGLGSSVLGTIAAISGILWWRSR